MRLLVLEDQPTLSDAIASHLLANGFVVDAVFDLRSAEAALAVGDFRAALIDLGLPDGDGLDLLGRLRRQGSLLPIIVMTARDQIRDRIKGLEMGADDYLVKPFDLDEMVARIQAVVRRYEGSSRPLQALGRLQIDRTRRRVLADGEEVQLTAKEWALLEKLATQSGAICSKEQLEQAIYSFDDDTGSNTLEVFVSRIRKKLGKDCIETVRGLGYRLTV